MGKMAASVKAYNVRSLKNKFSVLDQCTTELLTFQIVALTETWLNSSVGDDAIVKAGAVVESCWRLIHRSQPREDRVLNYPRKWCEKLLIGLFYRPPSSNISLLQKCCESVMGARSVGDIILLGD
ncbi:hypothetical protein J437_LFUL007195 [Ladona fulva]|uniref:Uncharacterized protein n=1 Tax=Ladona fulva TaxID=123851 RepID=A0A8K0P1Q3_LADFU|nr:hypothetical protein J437_LFUL007195 [Ladona fulva]